MTTFLIICLLIMPWVFIPHINIVDQFRLPQAFVMDFTFLGIIALSFFKGNNFLYKNKYLSWFLGWIFLNFIIYFFIPFGLEVRGVGRIINTATMEPMIHILLGTWALQAILTNFTKEDFLRVAKAICISASCVAGFAILQRIGLDPLKAIAKYSCANRVSACLDNPNLVGNYLALCFPLFFMFKNRIFRTLMLVVIGGIIAANSHFSIALMGLSIFIYQLFKNRFNLRGRLLIILSILIAIFIFTNTDFAKLNESKMSGRLPIWQYGVEKLKNNVLFGQGIGVWKTWGVTQTTSVGKTIWTYAHNDWLERSVEFGLIGLGLLLMVVVNAFRRFTYKGDENYSYITTFIVFLVMMFGSFPLEVPTIAILGLISFAAVEKM